MRKENAMIDDEKEYKVGTDPNLLEKIIRARQEEKGPRIDGLVPSEKFKALERMILANTKAIEGLKSQLSQFVNKVKDEAELRELENNRHRRHYWAKQPTLKRLPHFHDAAKLVDWYNRTYKHKVKLRQGHEVALYLPEEDYPNRRKIEGLPAIENFLKQQRVGFQSVSRLIKTDYDEKWREDCKKKT
jgi:hypothetical protein